jgi:hypothetical protein
MVPLSSFLKYYIAIETATKLDDERAGKVLPRRLAVLIAPWQPDRHAEIGTAIKTLIRERNAVFHDGRPQGNSSESLAYDAFNLARSVLNRLRERLISDRLATKAELRDWAKAQYKSMHPKASD